MKKFIIAMAVLVAMSAVVVHAEKFAEEGKVVSAVITNGQTIVLSAPEMRLTGAGQASGETNAVTVARPYPIDAMILISNSHAATNCLKFTDATTTLNLGADVVLLPGQSLLLKPVGSNACNIVTKSP